MPPTAAVREQSRTLGVYGVCRRGAPHWRGSPNGDVADPEEARVFGERGRRLCTYVDVLSGP